MSEQENHSLDNKNKSTVIVNRYNEDISWLNKIGKDIDIHIYNKGTSLDNYKLPSRSIVQNVDNVGRETEGYLRFMIEHYDDIKKDNYYFFLQGDPFDHSAKIIDKINNVHLYGKSLFYHLGDLICIDCDRVSRDRVSYYKKAHSTFLLQHASQANDVSIHNKVDMLFCNVILTKDIKLKLIYEHFVQQSKDRIHLYESLFHNAPSVFNWSEGALFVVKGSAILSHPQDYFVTLKERLLKVQTEDLGYLYERLWSMILFHGSFVSCV